MFCSIREEFFLSPHKIWLIRHTWREMGKGRKRQHNLEEDRQQEKHIIPLLPHPSSPEIQSVNLLLFHLKYTTSNCKTRQWVAADKSRKASKDKDKKGIFGRKETLLKTDTSVSRILRCLSVFMYTMYTHIFNYKRENPPPRQLSRSERWESWVQANEGKLERVEKSLSLSLDWKKEKSHEGKNEMERRKGIEAEKNGEGESQAKRERRERKGSSRR